MERNLNKQNIDAAIAEYERSIESIGGNISGLRGVELFQCIKRQPLNSGPYPHVTLFEAANRIMTDLVILKGVKWMLASNLFPFSEYIVEYGNEDNNDHDILALNNGKRLNGEAFNVAPSFFQSKKSTAIKKLRASKNKADYIVILINADAVGENYSPKLKEKEFFVFVDIISGKARVLSSKPIHPIPKSGEAD
ncbi:MAG: hypothetical protein ACI8SR_001984 [Oceanicoccus sp.]|jgi:hypothetical protein